ncbi:MAG TPA: tetraacyldisaccharide 4'-kinase [Bacteroidales bacterium]|nr:tetraacyldisaccharide 4'-kinase [Bacteroidales bacterium]
MNRKLQQILLFPFALIYGFIIRIRNFLFDTGIIKSSSFDLPVISVGNITVGGTGKTPHTEYLVNLLKKDYNVAVLSRGYKRKTRDFNIVEADSDVYTSGDEPLQIKYKHPELTVAVDRNRVHGINEILTRKPHSDIILLDDAFQHRYIEAGLSILLIDYNRLITDDYLLPAGRLREHRSSIKRADIVLITKSPPDLSPINMKDTSKKIPLSDVQYLFYTCIDYDMPKNIFEPSKPGPGMDQVSEGMKNVLLVTGIADPLPLINYLRKYDLEITHLKYPDHHNYTDKDCSRIISRYNSLPLNERCLITTEKDAIRLRDKLSEKDFSDNSLFYISIKVVFLNNNASEFNKYILNYVGKNTRNS